jgi:hypothetical protein
MIAWTFSTRKGRFSIAAYGARWHAFYGQESLGAYDSPTAALADLVAGNTMSLVVGSTRWNAASRAICRAGN